MQKSIKPIYVKKIISLEDSLILMLLENHDSFVNVVMILFAENVQFDDHLHHDIFRIDRLTIHTHCVMYVVLSYYTDDAISHTDHCNRRLSIHLIS